MSDIKKFLDYEGVQHLWSKINMQDYPNNETLINVINAIDETKADRSELVQSDWNQNDETAVDFIKNRPFYEETGATSIVLFDGDAQFGEDGPDIILGWYDEPKEFENGKTYTVTIGNEQQDIVCENDVLIFVSSELNMTFILGEHDIYIEDYDSYESSYHIKIETTEVSTTVKQLDEKYIPDTIARTGDIPSTAIKPFPYYAVNELNAFITQYKVNLEELEEGVFYSVHEFPPASTPYVFSALCIICDDGTEKVIINVATKTEVYYIYKTTKLITLYGVFDNLVDTIDISDKSTSSSITVVTNPLAKYLPIYNTDKYTPRDDYNPATKKYVDDTATTAANAIKNDLLNGAGEAYDTLKELGELIDDNVDAIEALEIVAAGKANVSDIPTKVSELTNDSGFITEAPQPDWNQNDETAVDYIKNKPFYEMKVSNIIYDGQVDLMKTTFYGDGLEGTYYDAEVSFEEGHIYNAIFNNENNEFVCQEAVCEQDGFLALYVQDSDFYVEIFSDDSIYIFSTNPEYFDYDIFGEGVYNLKIAEIETTPKTLDEKFIPDTIARIEDIPQSDWNQSDENAVDFIKNKPFYDIKVPNIIYDGQIDFTEIYGQVNYLEGTLDEGISCKKGHIYNAIFNIENNEFVCQEVVCEQDGYLTMPVQDYDYYVEIVDGYQISIRTNSEEYFDSDIFEQGTYNFKIAEIETTPKTLDEKFIPDTIARRKDILQSDWNQGDENAVDFIKNKPFYDIKVSSIIYDNLVEFSQDSDNIYGEILEGGRLGNKDLCKKGDTYKVILNYYDEFDDENHEFVCQEAVCNTDGLLTLKIQDYDYYVEIVSGDHILIHSIDRNFFDYDIFKPGVYNLKIEENRTAFKTLDEKFIPDTIARVEDIPVTSVNGQTGDVQINIQSDWNQTDESAVDFIKNRTHYEKEEMITRTCSFEYENIDSYEKITPIGRFLYLKISDDVYSRTTDVTLFVDLDGVEYSAPVSTCTDKARYRSGRVTNGSLLIGICYIIYADAVTINGVNLTKGIWFQIYGGKRTTYAHVTESYSVTTIKLLDEKFIPDTIARVEDIPEINYPVTSVNGQTGDVQINIPEQVQADWTQTDETATNYIKNKPILATSEEIKALFN